MKSIKTLTLLSCICLVFSSCSKTNKAVTEYCDCMNSIMTDSLLLPEAINERNKICYDSILNLYNLSGDKEFLSSFDSLNQVKSLRNRTDAKIYQNIDKILQAYNWNYKDMSSLNWKTYEYRVFSFDGKMFKQVLYGMEWGSTNWKVKNSWTGTYRIEKESDKIYVTLIDEENKNDIYRFRKSKADGLYLDGRRALWQTGK